MIVFTYEIVPIGRIIVAGKMCDRNKNKHFNVPCFVIREVTKEEYIEYCKETNCYHLVEWNLFNGSEKYYEVSVD